MNVRLELILILSRSSCALSEHAWSFPPLEWLKPDFAWMIWLENDAGPSCAIYYEISSAFLSLNEMNYDYPILRLSCLRCVYDSACLDFAFKEMRELTELFDVARLISTFQWIKVLALACLRLDWACAPLGGKIRQVSVAKLDRFFVEAQIHVNRFLVSVTSGLQYVVAWNDHLWILDFQ